MFLSVRRNNGRRYRPPVSYTGLTSLPWNIRYNLRKFFPLGNDAATLVNLSSTCSPTATRSSSRKLAINLVFTVSIRVCHRSRRLTALLCVLCVGKTLLLLLLLFSLSREVSLNLSTDRSTENSNHGVVPCLRQKRRRFLVDCIPRYYRQRAFVRLGT